MCREAEGAAVQQFALKVCEMYDQANMPQTITVPKVEYSGQLTIPNGEQYRDNIALLKDVKDFAVAAVRAKHTPPLNPNKDTV